MVKSRISAAIALVAFMSPALFGAAQHRSASAQTAKSTASEPSPTIQANANLVQVDVVVTHRNKPVLDIPQSRFHVFENGKERPIVAFDHHQPSANPASIATSAAALRKKIDSLPPNTYTNLPIYPSTGAVNVLLLDALNTPTADQVRARHQMIQYMKNVPPGTPIAIFTLASHLQMVDGFTTNAAQLADVLKGKKASPSPSIVRARRSASARRTLEQQKANLDVQINTLPPAVLSEILQSMQNFESDLTAFQTGARVHITLEALDELARYLGGIPGRKNLIWFSAAFPLALNPQADQSSFLNVEDYGDLVRQTSDLLTSARVAVYPVDARGLIDSPVDRANYMPPPETLSVTHGVIVPSTITDQVNRDRAKAINQETQEHISMNTVAEETGGRAFYDTNDLKHAVGSAIENGDSFYTLAFVPAGKLDGHYRKINVKVDDGRHYKLAYRRGYYADPNYTPEIHNPRVPTPTQAALLHGAPNSTQIVFTAHVLPATDPAVAGVHLGKSPIGKMTANLKGPLHRYLVQFVIDTHSLHFKAMAGGEKQAKMELVVMAYGPDGNRVNYEARSSAINLTPQQFQSTTKNGVHALLALDLPAGHDSLRLAVIDLNTEHTGSLEFPLVVASK